MKTISALLKNVEYTPVWGRLDREITAVVYDSRKVVEGCMFICIKGANVNGHDYTEEVCKKGAACIVVCEDASVPTSVDVTIIRTEDTRLALAGISANWFDNPADKLKVIGITGTKGKTTTTYLVKSILEKTGRKTGLIGTIETIIGKEHIPANNTTPESYILQETFAKMVDAGLDSVVMEVSSQGLMLHRTQGFVFDIGIFTNLEPDHIGPNEHTSFEHYMECKGLLFKQCKVGIVNCDDKHYKDVIKDHTCEILTYGLSEEADYKAQNKRLVRESGHIGVAFDVTGKTDISVEINTPGTFSVYNALAAVAICDQFGAKQEDVKNALADVSVKGRIELVKVSNEFTLMIDYAHNAMALESLLSTLKEYEPNRLVTVFGCGGNRSKLRRYEMGEVSGKLSDFTIITSDNPRFEKPAEIMDDIEVGMKKTDGTYIKIEDRKEAIRYAIVNGQPGDIIVLAGKGHEDYQEIEGVKYSMDERVLIREIMEEEHIIV